MPQPCVYRCAQVGPHLSPLTQELWSPSGHGHRGGGGEGRKLRQFANAHALWPRRYKSHHVPPAETNRSLMPDPVRAEQSESAVSPCCVVQLQPPRRTKEQRASAP